MIWFKLMIKWWLVLEQIDLQATESLFHSLLLFDKERWITHSRWWVKAHTHYFISTSHMMNTLMGWNQWLNWMLIGWCKPHISSISHLFERFHPKKFEKCPILFERCVCVYYRRLLIPYLTTIRYFFFLLKTILINLEQFRTTF